MDGLVAVETEDDMQSTETNITLEREKANQYGIETQMISGAISYTIRGNQVGYYYDSNGRRNRIRIWLGKNDRKVSIMSVNSLSKAQMEPSCHSLHYPTKAVPERFVVKTGKRLCEYRELLPKKTPLNY